MFCWLCILVFFVMKTNLKHNLSLIYFISQPLQVSGMLLPKTCNGMDMFKEWKREGYQKKLWNGIHQEENKEDLN
jgi:hypothetical protein